MDFRQIQSGKYTAIAVDFFRAHGFYKADYFDLASKFEISLSDLQIVFADKVYLAIEVMNYVQDIFDSTILVHAYDEAIPVHDRIVKLNNAIEGYFINSKGGCVFVNLCLDGIGNNEAFKEQIQRYFNSLNNAYQNILNEIYEPEEAQLLADEFVADLQGALIMMRVSGESRPIQRLSERFLERCNPQAE